MAVKLPRLHVANVCSQVKDVKSFTSSQCELSRNCLDGFYSMFNCELSR